MNNITRLPALPILTHDPMFSVWAPGELPTSAESMHWCGTEKPLRGTIVIDGILRRYFGRTGRQAMVTREVNVTPLSTEYVLEDLGVRLKLRFTSPLLPDDLDILSTPVTFVDFDVSFIDGKSHTVELRFLAPANLCHSGEYEPAMRQDFFNDGKLNFGYMGQLRQTPLCGSGDHLTLDWGYLFLASEDAIDDDPTAVAIGLRYIKKAAEPFHSTLLIGYDDVASINYFGRLLPAYYARNGKTITEAIREFSDRRGEILARCAAFDAELTAEAEKKGGKDYALICTAAYRQTVAAHKLVADENGELLFISKENDSNGCGATVDVSYPSVPVYLMYCPELVRAMCRPILKFAKMPVWHYDFAPHDVGRYPILNGQIYAAKQRLKKQSTGVTHAPYYLYPATTDEYIFEKQMPVEESADMLLMLAGAGYADGNYDLARANLDTLRTWCGYLLKYGEDPGEQLCTDDFAGHLARNVNLSAKAFVGIAAFAQILEALGEKEEAESYMEKARAMAKSWLKRADVGGYTCLTFNGDGWSQKYNLVWDKLFGFDLLPEEFYEKELRSYLGRLNEYGLPLDSRASYTKSDWSMWTAAMTDDRAVFDKFTAPMVKFLQETTSRVPFSDFYDTKTGLYERFIARSVQGGLFMPLLMERFRARRK